MSTLERAIEIALEAHRGCTDKGEKPYILHPLHVMLQMKSNEGKIVGVLHDVAEDSDDWNLERLRAEGFSDEIIDAIDSVTEREGESYEDFIARAKQNRIGRCVKLADLRHNSDLTRLEKIEPKHIENAEKYRRSIETLEEPDLP